MKSRINKLGKSWSHEQWNSSVTRKHRQTISKQLLAADQITACQPAEIFHSLVYFVYFNKRNKTKSSCQTYFSCNHTLIYNTKNNIHRLTLPYLAREENIYSSSYLHRLTLPYLAREENIYSSSYLPDSPYPIWRGKRIYIALLTYPTHPTLSGEGREYI